MKYSLIQKSLDQSISREDLEEASVGVPSVARADCAVMSRGMFGILVSGLLMPEAKAFQGALRRHGFDTDVVADCDLPVLHESYQYRRVRRDGERLVLHDSMGREVVRPRDELVFVAAGFIRDTRRIGENVLVNTRSRAGSSTSGVGIGVQRQYRDQEELSFRIDFFFHEAPRRVHLELTEGTVIFHGDEKLRLKDRSGLAAMSRSLAGMVPPVRWNRFLTHMDLRPEYPSSQAYDEELRWLFYRLLHNLPE